MRTVEGDFLLAAPREPEHLDRLLEGIDRLARAPRRPAHRRHPFEQRTRPEPELEAAAAQEVERGGLLGQHRGRTERQVGDVGEEAQALRLREQRPDQGERVEEAPLVRVILYAHEVETAGLRGAHHRPRGLELVGRGNDRDAELELSHQATRLVARARGAASGSSTYDPARSTS